VRRALLVAGLALAVLLVSALAASSARAADVLDQSQPNANHSSDINPPFGDSVSEAQIFTPGKTGTLNKVDLGLGLECAAGCPSTVLNVGIYATDASGLPTGTALGTGTVSPTNPNLGVGCCTLITVPISPGVSVSAGTKYAIVLTDTGCCGSGFILGFDVNDPYPGGNHLENFNNSGWRDFGWDTMFQTYIDAPTGPTGPTSKADCKNGGWRDFGDMFKNQGQCVTLFDTDS
jgi:hypothetical protein